MISAHALGADYTVHVVTPAVTDHLILPDGPLPAVCKQQATITLFGCRGQYEPASFVVTATKPLDKVRVTVDPLSGDGGQWPEDAVDVRVVKAYFTQSKAVPTLLVHDDSFLAIEPAPTEANPKMMKNVARGELRDTPTLQPVTIEKRRQFWITVRIPDHARPGTYSTTVRILPENSDASELKLQVEVYPFDLRAPMLEYSIYYPVNLVADDAEDWLDGRWTNTAFIKKRQYIAECRNMLVHGLSNPNIYNGVHKRPDGSLNYSSLEKVLAVREEAGIGPGVPLYTMNSAAEPITRALKAEEKKERVRMVRQIMAWSKKRGYPDMYWMGQDEAWGDWLASERDSFQAIYDGGGKVFAACFGKFFEIMGDLIHQPVMLIDIATPLEQFAKQQEIGPEDALRRNAELARLIGFERQVTSTRYRQAIDGVHRLGRKIFAYTTQRHVMPDWHRRQEGLGLWRMGFDGVMNWAYIHIGGEGAQQSMIQAMVFRTDGGVLDTLYWEGFREGVDDIRYLTTLLAVLNGVIGRFPDEPLIADTHQWLKTLDVATGDLDAIRREMARRIIALQDLGHKDLTPAEALANIDRKRIEIVNLGQPWRFKLVEVEHKTLMGPNGDAADVGMHGKWFLPKTDDSQWKPMPVGGGYTREAGGGWGTEGGYGWYRTKLPLTKARLARKFHYLHFKACDEDAWIYLNGAQILAHTLKETNLLTSEIWLTPFAVSLNDVRLKGDDLLAVRIRNTEGMGGIWKSVHLIVSDQKLNDQQVHALITLKTAKD